MVDKDMLATFKKHLGEFDKASAENISHPPLNKTSKIKKFSQDIKSANEFIGAIQILDISLTKLISQSQRMLLDDSLSDLELKSLENIITKEINEIIENCSFMGTKLFDTTLSIQIHSKSIEIDIPNPTPLIQNEGYEGMIIYLEDKKSEIQNTLRLVSSEISGQKIFDSNVSETQTYENFNPKDFLKMT